MELMRNDFEDDDHEEEKRKEKVFNEQQLIMIKALKEEVAVKKELLMKKEKMVKDKEDQLKAMHHEKESAREKHILEKRILEQKLEDIREKNGLLRKLKESKEEDLKKASDKKAERKKKKEAVSNETTPVITEQMQAEYEAQINELKKKVETTKQEVSATVNYHKEIEREIKKVVEYGKDLSDHKEQLVNQIAELEEKLIENAKEQNKLVKEKAEFEAELKLNQMADHCEKGNSMVAEIEDGNQIMTRNLKIVNQKCIEIKKKIALKSFELGKLKESHANLLYDLKKKNNYTKSAYGVVQGEIDEFKIKIEELERRMESLVQIENGVQVSAGDDSMEYLKTMFTSKMKSVRDAVLECQDVSKQTFVKREALFQLEFEFRNLKSELREYQNKVSRHREELKVAIEESEKKPDVAAEEIDVQKTNTILQPTCHPEKPSPDEKIEEIAREENVGESSKTSAVLGRALNGEIKQEEGEDLDPTAGSSTEVEELGNQDDPCSGHSSHGCSSSEDSTSANNTASLSSTSISQNVSSDVINASSFIDEENLAGRFKNVNSSLALGKENVRCDLSSESSFIDEEALASKFKNINSSLMNRNNIAGGVSRAPNSRNLLHDFTNTSSSNDDSLGSKFKSTDGSVNLDNLASELMFADKENSDLINF